MPTVLEAIKEVLMNNNGIADYPTIYKGVSNIRNGGIPLSNGQKASVRKTIENYSSDSDNYLHKDNVFYSVNGIGNGIWGLRK